MSLVTLIRGLPGSGKSTLAELLVMNGYYEGIEVRHFEADQYFLDADGNYVYDASKMGAAHEWCRAQYRQALVDKTPVIVSNTFTTIKELKPYFEIAKEYDIVPNVILCDGHFKSVHGVPDETMRKMRGRFVYDIDALYNNSKEVENSETP